MRLERKRDLEDNITYPCAQKYLFLEFYFRVIFSSLLHFQYFGFIYIYSILVIYVHVSIQYFGYICIYIYISSISILLLLPAPHKASVSPQQHPNYSFSPPITPLKIKRRLSLETFIAPDQSLALRHQIYRRICPFLLPFFFLPNISKVKVDSKYIL